MWLSGRARERAASGDERALLGTVTLEGTPAGAYADGERRELPVYGPGGYRWKPTEGQQVLVLKTGGEGELPCVAGAKTESDGLKPGEVALETADGRAGVRLGMDGSVRLTGAVWVNGMTLEQMIQIYSSPGGV